ncbi:hypothetical protein PLICRDRAFT_698715 [Plicaturopsis crispa FD-325 SS-3]|nr:hypothetical protein PLICRDRAFT_698715 [Plicaturopsis crispa FD-325 SS-3]
MNMGASHIEHVYPPSQANGTNPVTATTNLHEDSEATTMSDHANNFRDGDQVERDDCDRTSTLPYDIVQSVRIGGGAVSADPDLPRLPRAQSLSSFDSTSDASHLSANVHSSRERAYIIQDEWESPLQREPPSEQYETVTQGAHHESARRITTTATGLSATLALIFNFASPTLSALDASSKAYTLGLITRFLLYSSFVTGIGCGLAAAAMLYTPYVPRWMMRCCVFALVAAVLQGLGGVAVFATTMEDTALAVAVIGQLVVCVLFIVLCGLCTYGPTRAWILDGLRISGE